MPLRVLRVLTVCTLAVLPACRLYGTARMEFDSATGFDLVADPDAAEPDAPQHREQVLRWPWLVRVLQGSGIDWLMAVTLGVRPRLVEVAHSARLVRERMIDLTDLAIGDFGRTADVAQRLLWVAARDEHTLDQIHALQSITRLLESLHVDPLLVPLVAPDPVAAAERVDDALLTIATLIPARRGEVALAAAERAEYLDALAAVAERPSGSAAQGRAALRLLRRAAATETDPELRNAAHAALADVLAAELAQALRVKLSAPSPDVRLAALLNLHHLSGPRVVPYSLGVLASRPAGGGAWIYDLDESFRRAWVRLCGQLPKELVFESYAGGPAPIEFLYDTVRGDEVEALRLVALAAMAQVLREPKVTLDREWADEWWRSYSLRQGATEGGD